MSVVWLDGGTHGLPVEIVEDFFVVISITLDDAI